MSSTSQMVDMRLAIVRLRLAQLRQLQIEQTGRCKKLSTEIETLDGRITRSNEILKAIRLQSQLMDLVALVEHYADTLELIFTVAQGDSSTFDMLKENAIEMETYEKRIKEALNLYKDLSKVAIA